MNYATIKPFDVANGPGVRVSLFVSGCTHRCKGCFNEEAWDFNYGEEFTEKQEKEILEAMKPDYIKGFSLLGGEPFEPRNQAVLAPFLEKIKKEYPDKDIWCYSGYDFEKDLLTGRLCDFSITDRMLSQIDILVDGKFVEELKNLKLRFKGSENQRIIDVKKSREENRVILWEGDTNAV
ncbi:MAG: anaerobic ribonucleoside-triphosphate reductase activating protein [Acutalibacteraceae bacterium]|nr:anaerobic ribonucleoside-triphosphate reductase activating protein [Acutalibacteraceae bacterium]